MSDITLSKEELINEINMLKMQIAELKQELDLYKEDNNIKEKYELDSTLIKEILEDIPSAVVIIDATEEKFAYLNKRALDIYGINYLGFDLHDHVAKVKALKFDGTHFPLDEMPVRHSLKYGKKVRNKKMIIERADGKQTPILVSSSPLFDDKGKVVSAIVTFEDITDLKKTQDLLKASEAKLRTVLDNSRDCLSMFDIRTRKYIYFSQPNINLGFNANEFNNISAEDVYERVYPNDREIFIEQHKMATSGLETMENMEYRWKCKNGEYRWFENWRKLVYDENGQPIAFIGTLRDINDQKEYENELILKAKILSNINDAIIHVDEYDKIMYYNKAFVKLFGWQEQELIGHQFFDIVQGFVDETSKEKILLTLEPKYKAHSTVDENILDEIICYSKHGTQIIIEINRTVVINSKGEFKGFILSIRDIRERYENELKLKKSEEKYRYLYNSIDEGFIILDVIFDKENKLVDFRYVELNPAYEKQIGLLNKNVQGKTLKELNLDLEDFLYEIYGKVALTGEPIRFVDKSEVLNRWFDSYVFKIDLEERNRLGIIFSDVTEKVMYNSKLEELVKMQDEIYVNVSHELKTPLNVIFSANQVMDMYLKSDSIQDKKDKLFNYNNVIKQNCYRLIKLINNIVDLSKGNSGLLKLNLCNVNIVDVIENIVQSVKEYVNSKELKIIFDTNVEEKIIACDPDKIERIILNLISNAIKFSKQNSEIFVNVLSKEETVEIRVKDTGIGIEKQNLDNIFNRFYQENKSLSRNAEGSGIGLSLIKSLVEMHGGNISVDSEVNKGSIFKIELPVRTTESQELREQNNYMNNKIENIKIEFSDIYSIN